MRLNWKPALKFMFESPVFNAAWYWGGILLLVCPPIGWVIALGYRSLVLRYLLNTGEVAQIRLPAEWKKCLLSGVGAAFVIFAYFLPFMTIYWALVASHYDLSSHTLEIISFFVLVLLFIPAFLPTLPLFFAWYFPWIKFSTVESAILAAIFFLTTFLMPAVFMQVSLKGSYWGATRFRQAIKTILCYPLEYLEAWGISLVLISLSFIILPLFPWITFWAYLVIGILFNNVLAFDQNPLVAERMQMLKKRFIVTE